VNEYTSDRSSGKALKVVGVVLLVIVLVGVLLGYGAVRGWEAFVRFGVASDLSEYQTVITASSLGGQTKSRLVERIDLIRERARDKPISFFRWLSYDESFRAVLGDRTVTADEVLLLERELARLEREFD
jgi:hypothetical protein